MMSWVEVSKVRLVTIYALLLAYWAVPHILVAADQQDTATAAPNVVFEAFGTFTKPPISGTDLFRLQGEPFTVSVAASAASAPVKSGNNWAVYSPLHLLGTVKSGLLQAPTTLNSYSTSVELSYNASGEPFTLATPLRIVNLDITLRADILMPAGTLATLLIHPFTQPVALTPANATLTYTDGGESTVLGINGVLTTSVQTSIGASAADVPAAAALMLHGEGAEAITVHPDGTRSIRPAGAGPVALGGLQDTTLLRFYASGARGAGDVRVHIAGQDVPVLYSGASAHFGSMDEVTVQLPRSLAGTGPADVELAVDGRAAAPVRIYIQ